MAETANSLSVGVPGSFVLETLSGSKSLLALELSTQFEPLDQAYPYGSLSYLRRV